MTETSHGVAGAPRRIFVAGANGYIGRHVVRELARRGYDVTAFVRPTAARHCVHDPFFATVRIHTGDVSDACSVSRDGVAGRRFDAFVSCIAARDGSPEAAAQIDYAANRHLLRAARVSGAEHFVLLSAICVQNPVLAFQRAKLAFESELQNSDLAWSIVRPTAFFKSLAGQIDRIKQGRAFVLFGLSGEGPACIPISEPDTARFMANCLESPALRNRILPVGGPGPSVTPLERGRMLFELAGVKPRFRRLPVAVFSSLIPLMDIGGRLSPRLARAAEFARIGRFYATEPMLVRNARGEYSATETPRSGQDTLDDFYRRVWKHGKGDQHMGGQALF